MSKMIRLIGAALLIGLSFILALALLGHPSHWTKPGRDDVYIQVFYPSGSASTTRLLALVTNETEEPIIIDRRPQWNSIVTHIYDAKSGEEVGWRAMFNTGERIWRESDVLELPSKFSYGLIVDVRDKFAVKEGGAYRVSFEYRIMTSSIETGPTKVGRLEPWLGVATSRLVEMHVPSDPAQPSILSTNKLYIQVFPISDARLLALITNGTDQSVVIDRLPSESLRAHVYGAVSGEDVGRRAVRTSGEREWRKSDLLELPPGFSYGTSMDISDEFAVKEGSTYRVRFEYRRQAPAKVGELRPWRGSALSREVEIRIPPRGR